MINSTSNPVAWALLVQGIAEAQEHLASLAEQLSRDGMIEVEDFVVQVGHAYAHLNRAWNGRNHTADEMTDAQWDAFSQFPLDIEPVG
jgi:hypothetical protein